MAAAAPCENPVCSSKKDAFRAMLRGPPGGGAAAEPTAAAPPCPADREELGRHTWTLVRLFRPHLHPGPSLVCPLPYHRRAACGTTQMHTMAAYFPEKPTDVQREAASSFIRALGALYPCSHCAEDFRVALDESPPRCG